MIPCDEAMLKNKHPPWSESGVGVRRVSIPSEPRLLPLPEKAPGSWLCKGFMGPAKDSGCYPASPLLHKDLSFCCRQNAILGLGGEEEMNTLVKV